jgi:hypothetical protein
MPTKFKQSEKVFKRGVKASKLKDKHFYIKDVNKDELFKCINEDRTKPKQRQKCLNELARRGIQINWVEPSEVTT